MKKAGLSIVAGAIVITGLLILGIGGMPGETAGQSSPGSAGQTLQAGRNVNMVSGTKLPFGDPWLQRQNEPSIATSSRNPMHLLGGANDYRTIDIPDDFKLPGIDRAAAADAWLGVYESFDGGESWVTTLLPGFPQDLSAEGMVSPLKAYETACDPIVRSAANGLFYYCGIAFNRTSKASALFVARYVDDNNREKVELETVPNGTQRYAGPLRYIDTRLVATGSTGSSFIDMPNMAVDVPRGRALYGTIYVAYTVFSDTGASSTADKIFLQRSTDGGVTWSMPPVQLSLTGEIVQRPIIAIDPTDLKGNTVYVAFRRFAKGTVPDGIVVVRSTNGGKTFTRLPDPAPSFYPFDQGTSPSPASFRTNSYPTLAVGDLGTVYAAWSQRMGGQNGQARIMVSALRRGNLTWTSPRVVDGTYAGIGHQFMPSLTFAAWKLMLVWYDQRQDVALDALPFIGDPQGQTRHTIDIRAAEGNPGVPPSFSPSVQLSRYLHVLDLDANGDPIEEGGYYRVIQAEYSHINYPLFQLGTVPFHGDYLEVTPSVRFLPPAIALGSWIYNINPLEPTSFHAAWTDNRDVRPPNGDMWGDWVNYNPPGSIQEGWPADGPPTPCLDGSKTGMKNQNVYSAHINKGLIMGSPGNTKQLDLAVTGEGGRTFVVFLKNTTAAARTLNLLLLQIGGVNASFDQFEDDNTLEIVLQPYSSASCTVYVDRSTRSLAPVLVNAFEGLRPVGYAVLNPDPTNLPLADPDNPFQDLGQETHDPDVSAPFVWNYDLNGTSDPNASAVLNPRVQNPRVQNDSVVNPRVQNEGVLNPRVQNESIVNSEVPNPRVQNTAAPNAALTDVTWTVTNEGNTTSAFTINIRSLHPEYFNGDDPPLIAQVLVYKLHRVPVDKECQLSETHQDELIANITNPRVQNPRVQNTPVPASAPAAAASAVNLGAQDISFYLAPGEQADVLLRVWDEDTTDGRPTFSPDQVIAEAAAEAVNTADVMAGGTTPPFDSPPNAEPWETPQPAIGAFPLSLSFTAPAGANPPSQLLSVQNTGSGTVGYSVSDDADWLNIAPSSGQAPQSHTVTVDATGLGAGSYTATITIIGPNAANNPLRIPVSLSVSQMTPVPSRAALTGPTRAGAGFLSGAFTLTVLDQFGDPIAVAADTVFDLASNSDDIHAFYSAPDAKARTTRVVVPAGSVSTEFYYQDSVPSLARDVIASWASGGPDLGSANCYLWVWPVVGQIVYSASGTGGRGLIMMQPDGTGKTAVMSGASGQYFDSDWSPDGSRIAFSATGIIGGQQSAEIFIMNADGSWLRRLTDNLLGEMTPRWSPDGTRIVFARSMTDPGYHGSEDASCEIFIMNADGSGESRLTDDGTYDGGPAWSADGLKIVFTSRRLGSPRIFIMNADGSGPEVLSGAVHWDFGPDWSPTGDRLAITRANGYAHIYTVDSDGTDPLQLCFDPLVGNFPRFSPDGGRLVFMGSPVSSPWEIYRVSADWPDPVALTNSGSSESLGVPSWGGSKFLADCERGASHALYVMNPDGSGLTRLTGGTPLDMNADWSSDGTKVVFERYDGTHRDIWTMNADGTSQTNLTDSASGIVNSGPAWSPDGTKIAFSSNRAGDSEIYTMNADGTGLVRVTNAPNTDSDPAWSPDGTKIAFWSNRDAVLGEIYVMNADGSNVVRLTNNTVADGSACWSPDGTKIAFFSERDGNPEIYVMNADGSSPVRLTVDPGSDGTPCWSPNGREIAFVRSDVGTPALFNLYVMSANGTQLRRVGDLNGRTMSPSWRTKRDRTPHLY